MGKEASIPFLNLQYIRDKEEAPQQFDRIADLVAHYQHVYPYFMNELSLISMHGGLNRDPLASGWQRIHTDSKSPHSIYAVQAAHDVTSDLFTASFQCGLVTSLLCEATSRLSPHITINRIRMVPDVYRDFPDDPRTIITNHAILQLLDARYPADAVYMDGTYKQIDHRAPSLRVIPAREDLSHHYTLQSQAYTVDTREYDSWLYMHRSIVKEPRYYDRLLGILMGQQRSIQESPPLTQ